MFEYLEEILRESQNQQDRMSKAIDYARSIAFNDDDDAAIDRAGDVCNLMVADEIQRMKDLIAYLCDELGLNHG